MRFNQSPDTHKDDLEVADINGVPASIYQQLLHAEIEYHANNYPLAIKILSELAPQLDGLGKQKEFIKAILDHNLAVILANYRQTAPAQIFLRKSLNYFATAK